MYYCANTITTNISHNIPPTASAPLNLGERDDMRPPLLNISNIGGTATGSGRVVEPLVLDGDLGDGDLLGELEAFTGVEGIDFSLLSASVFDSEVATRHTIIITVINK